MLSLMLLTAELNTATPVTFNQVSRLARVCRVPCGYRMVMRSGVEHATRAYTEQERAWFRRPLGGAK